MQFEVASEKVIHKRMDDEVMVINLDTGHYYSIEGAGIPMWEALTASVPVSRIAERFAAAYPDIANAPETVAGFAEDLAEAALLARAESAAAGEPDLDWPQPYLPPRIEVFDDVSELIAMDPPLPELE